MDKWRVELIRGDITSIDADAIVNAANSTLRGGGGVDGAIHAAAGPGLLAECVHLNGCQPGQSKITKGYKLKAKFVIHTVGPVWHGGLNDEEKLLASCYFTSLTIAKEKQLKIIAFPGISTGAYGFPIFLAATIAVNETERFLMKNSFPEKVIFVAFNDESYEIYKELLDR